MPETTTYAAGTPSWVDLLTSDPEGARAFYGALFGWEFEIGGPETGHYAQARLNGLSVAGIVGEPAPEGMPTAWTTYLAVDDTDAIAQRIGELGGKVQMGPMDVMDEGRVLIAMDPTGAIFGTWQAGAHAGAQLVNEPGSLSWNELSTRDLDAARAFYSGVFGHEWEFVDTGEGGPAYYTFAVGGRAVGGAMEMTSDWPAEVPSHWTPYFQVADTDAAVASVERLGGDVMMPATDSPYGRFAFVSDPQGGAFTVVKSAQIT